MGTTLDLGANPGAASDRRAAGVIYERDLRTYRTLLAYSDGLSAGRPQEVAVSVVVRKVVGV